MEYLDPAVALPIAAALCIVWAVQVAGDRP